MNELSRYDKHTVVVLGASGFIGRWVARKLCSVRAKVYLVVRNKTIAEQIFTEYHITGTTFELDLSDTPKALETLFQEIRPSITFNLAGYGVDRSEREEKMAYQIRNILCPLAQRWQTNGNDVKTIEKVLAELPLTD